MAMTKKEAAALAEARREARIARALRWSDPPPPRTVMAPDRGYANGWVFNSHAETVERAWTERVAHSIGEHRTDDGDRWKHGIRASQNGRPLFATRLDALLALRSALERNAAETLAKIDDKIEAERVNPTATPPGRGS